MQDSYLDEEWQIPFEEAADQMLKGKTVHFVVKLNQNTETKQREICGAWTTHTHIHAQAPFLHFQVHLRNTQPCFILSINAYSRAVFIAVVLAVQCFPLIRNPT